ncbi:unnamed protein product [Rotaria sordida]|uniref:Uncharacterized protein n=1 Tax=Rotaria sordida TaxID=392033 RepID=A0A815BIS6_9BILA|nr:unnamed protein product [Rotaria sordida]CAF1550565.1 unnamed protein product [Rotaria sordida]
MRYSHSILIVEDAENIVRDRNQDIFITNQAVSNLLNLSDGLLDDAMHQQIICTFNCDVKSIDSALLRDGQLVVQHKFDKLNVENARRLCLELGIPGTGISQAALCPLVFTQKNFTVTKYTGVWYETYRRDIKEVDTKCNNDTFTSNAHGTMDVLSRAYNILQTGVLNELLAVNVASLDDTAVSQLVNRLYCGVQRAYALLQQSVLSSENLQVEVNNRLTLNVAQAGAYEENIRGKETEVLQTNQALSNALSQLTLAEHAVIEKQNAVANADQAVRDAEEAVEKARKCRGKRSWFSKITRPIVRPIENLVKDVIIKPVCSVINEGGIDNAKNRRGYAYDQLTSAQNQERHSRQVVVETQIMKANLEAQLDQLRSSLANVQAALKTLRSELVVTTNINQELKQVTTQLSNVFIGSSVLQNTIAHLIDFELLINPLNAVYDAIHQITALGATTSISQSQVQQTKTNEKTDETLLYRYLPSDGGWY